MCVCVCDRERKRERKRGREVFCSFTLSVTKFKAWTLCGMIAAFLHRSHISTVIILKKCELKRQDKLKLHYSNIITVYTFHFDKTCSVHSQHESKKIPALNLGTTHVLI